MASSHPSGVRPDDDPSAQIRTEHWRGLFIHQVWNSPVSVLATVFLIVFGPAVFTDQRLVYWVAANIAFQSLRFLMGLMGMRAVRRGPFDRQAHRRWTIASLGMHLVDGMTLVALALAIYPQYGHLEQVIVMMTTLIIVASTASSLAGHWTAVAIYAFPAFAAFTWATAQQDHPYSGPLAVMVGVFFLAYAFQVRNQYELRMQGFELSRQNAELARGNGELAVQLQTKNEQLQEVAAARSRLLATVSHDLRQPAHAIGLLCERVQREDDPAFVQTALSDLNELSQSLSASLTTLMDLTRLDAGLVRPSVVDLPLSQVLQRLYAEFGGTARNRGLGFAVPATGLWVRSDPVLLHGMLANLVSNAIKYTRQGRVDLELATQGQDLLVTVRDTGPGIAADKLDVIFKEFVRLEGAEPGTEGLGLGLSIVRRYALLLGHGLSVSSQPLAGTCFSIRLPLAQALAGPSPAPGPAAGGDGPSPAGLAGQRILVVDNVELVLSSMVRTLSGWGCQVHAAKSLADARQVAEHHALDLVITDFHLGDHEPNGLALVQALRGLPGRGLDDLPCLLMTGDVSGGLEAQARQHRVGVLHKPVRPAVLQERLQSLLFRSLPAAAPADSETAS